MTDRRRVNFRESPLSSGASSRYASDSGAGSLSDFPGSSAVGGSNASSRYSSSDRTAFAGHDHMSQWHDFATLEKAYEGAVTSKDQWKIRAKDLEADVHQLEKELQDIDAKRHEAVGRLKQQADDDRADLEGRVKKIKEENHKLDEANRKLDEENHKLLDENHTAMEENRKLMRDLKTAKEKVNGLEDEVAALRQALAEANARCNELQCNVVPAFPGGTSPGNNTSAVELSSSRNGSGDKKASSSSTSLAGSASREVRRASSTKSSSSANSSSTVKATRPKHDAVKDLAKEQKKRLSLRFDSKDEGALTIGSKADNNSNTSSSSSGSSSSHRHHHASSGGSTSANGASSGHHSSRQGGSNSSNGSNDSSGPRQPRARRQSFVEPFGPGGHGRAAAVAAATAGSPHKSTPRVMPVAMPGPSVPVPGMFPAFGSGNAYFPGQPMPLVSPRGETKLVEGTRPSVMIYDEAAADFPYQGDNYYMRPR